MIFDLNYDDQQEGKTEYWLRREQKEIIRVKTSIALKFLMIAISQKIFTIHRHTHIHWLTSNLLRFN